MNDLTPDERKQAATALEREIIRLDSLVKDYMQARSGTRNPSVKAMAEEGRINIDSRIKELKALAVKLRGPEQR